MNQGAFVCEMIFTIEMTFETFKIVHQSFHLSEISINFALLWIEIVLNSEFNFHSTY